MEIECVSCSFHGLQLCSTFKIDVASLIFPSISFLLSRGHFLFFFCLDMQLPFSLALQKRRKKKKVIERKHPTSSLQHTYFSVLGKLWGCWWMLGLAVDTTRTGCVSPTDAEQSAQTRSAWMVMFTSLCQRWCPEIQESSYLPPESWWSAPASLRRHRGTRVSAHHTSVLHLLLTHPSICALHPSHLPSFRCVQATFTAQHWQLSLHLFPSLLLFLA